MSDAPLTIRLNPADNVVTARVEMLAGVAVPGEPTTTLEAIPRGHKIATVDIAAGAEIRKYNQVIGFATTDIPAGGHVHVQNVEMRDFDRDYA